MTSGDLTSATVAIPRQNFAVRVSVPNLERTGGLGDAMTGQPAGGDEGEGEARGAGPGVMGHACSSHRTEGLLATKAR